MLASYLHMYNHALQRGAANSRGVALRVPLALALALALALTALARGPPRCPQHFATVAPNLGFVDEIGSPPDKAHVVPVVPGAGPPLADRPGHCEWIFNSPSV